MRVYHFIGSQHGLENIKNRHLKVSNLMDLNDPFEFLGVDTSNKIFKLALKNTKKQLSKYNGIICFSKKWRNPVQWAHYAHSHKGLCLGFDIPDSILVKVEYIKNRLDPPQELNEEFMRKLLRTKFTHWKYEAEHRIWVGLSKSVNGLYFKVFSDDLVLKEVIVGANSEVSREDVKETLGNIADSVEVFKTRPANKTFTMVRQRKLKLWK